MPQHPDNSHSSSSLPFRSHTAHLLATALPFLQPAYRHPVELITKFLEFSETIKLYQEFHSKGGAPFAELFQGTTKSGRENGLFGLVNTFIVDVEGLLQSLSCVCTGGEKEIIGMFLSLIRAKNFYETYGDLLKMGNLFPSGDDGTSFYSGENQASDTSFPTQHDAECPFPPDNESTAPSGFPFPGDLTSMLSDDQKETLDLLKSLFAED